MDELAGLSEEARKLAMERFRLLQPNLENNKPLTSVAQAAGIPYRTAHRLASAYRRSGLAALVRKSPSNSLIESAPVPHLDPPTLLCRATSDKVLAFFDHDSA
jgi:hypothetical protein